MKFCKKLAKWHKCLKLKSKKLDVTSISPPESLEETKAPANPAEKEVFNYGSIKDLMTMTKRPNQEE